VSTKSKELPPLYVKTREPLSPAESGLRGARKRWGEPRVVRLDQLDADTARLIRVLIAQREAQPAKVDGDGS
jgi:hypothetical protein